jgi:signal transduction histidine kinase
MVAGMLAGSITLYHTLLDLSDRRDRRFRLLLFLGYAIYGFLLYLNFSGGIVADAWFVGDRFRYSLSEGAFIAYIMSFSFLIFGIYILVLEILKLSGKMVRRRLMWPIFGAVLMLIGVLFNLYEPLGQYPIDLLAATTNAFFIFYAIYKYRIVHYSATVLRIVLYFILVITSAFIFYGIIWIFFRGIREIPFGYAIIPSILLGLAAGIIFQPLRSGAMAFIERLYFGSNLKYYEGLRNFSTTLSSVVELDVLGTSTIEKIIDTFKLEWAMMAVLDYSSRDYKIITAQGFPLEDLDLSKALVDCDSLFSTSVTGKNGFTDVTLNLPGKDIRLAASLVIPLRFKQRLNGCIVLGACREKDYYDQFDFEILGILAGQCSISLENAISFERLKRQQKRLQEMNEELIISRNKLEAFFDGITTPISIQDINYNVITINFAAAQYARKSFDEIIGKKCYQVFFGRNMPCKTCAAQDCLHTHIPFNTEVQGYRSEMTFDIHFYPIAVPQGSDKIFLEFFQDVTLQKKLQEELIQSEKLAGIGTLASGIAHEINNPLGGIIGTAEIMIDEVAENPALYEYTKDIITYAQNAAEVIRDLTTYSRKKKTETLLVDVVELLRNSLKLTALGLDMSGIEIRQDLQPVPDMEANRNELQQVFMNLIINAVQAMPEGGILSLSCKSDAGSLNILISDTGKGIENNHLDKIFNPFFTTKEPGKGTGLGVSISHRIIDTLGGRISVESRTGSGSEFLVQLPLSEEEKNRVWFVHARSEKELEDVFYIQRKILVGEKGYMEETIRRNVDEKAFHILAYRGLRPVGTVSCILPEMTGKLPIEEHITTPGLTDGKRCVEIGRLAALRNERANIVPLGLMTLSYLFAKSRNAERLLLDVFSDDKKYIAMYRKLGFHTVGEYSDPLPVTVMTLDYQTDYERVQKRMDQFVKPFMNRLLSKIHFEDEEQDRIVKAMEKVVAQSTDQ